MNPGYVSLHFKTEHNGQASALDATIESLVIAGWTGRDPAAMEAHIVELEKLGVARPKSTPMFYRVAGSLLTNATAIEVVDNHSSGEVEPVVVGLSNGLWLGVGSDHTDRKIETIGVAISKQLCAKPVAVQLWRLDAVADHWDDLIIRSYATQQGHRRLYQEGPLSKMRSSSELIERYRSEGGAFEVGSVMFCGTTAVHGDIAPAETFEIELEDPVLKRKITHSYRINVHPAEG